MQIAVIGAGINGLSVAVNLLETLPGVKVTIFTEATTPNTTGDVAAGLWKPYAISEDDHHLNFDNVHADHRYLVILNSKDTDKTLNFSIVKLEAKAFIEALIDAVDIFTIGKWCKSTYSFLTKLIANDPKHHKYGLCYIDVFELSNEPMKMKLYDDIVDRSHFMNEAELKRYPTFKYGIASTTVLSEGQKILSYFNDRFTQLGGAIKIQQVTNFDEIQKLGHFPIVINCTGLGSRKLCNDNDIYPVRGQVIRIHAPWIKHCVLDDCHYIIPQSDGVVVLGGTTQAHNWNTLPDENDTKYILKGCQKLLKGLEDCNILSVNVGLRPRRKTVRLEKENRTNEITGNKYTLIHNYGHGGSGFTLFWGCSEHVVQLVSDAMLKSKL